MLWKRIAVPVLALSGLLVHPASRAIEAGQVAPACELAALGSSPAGRTDQFLGRVVYVDFWASWCAPCLKAFPFLNTLDHDLHARGLQIVGVNVDEEVSDARAFLQQHAARFVVGSDAQGLCPRAFGVKGMPTSYLLDRRGMVRLVHNGFRPGEAEALRHTIEELLGEDGQGMLPAAAAGDVDHSHHHP